MTNLIHFDSEKGIFVLANKHISYIMEIVENHYLIHRYWGQKISSYHFSNRPLLKKRTFASTPFPEKPMISPDFLPFEFPTAHQGDFRNSAIEIMNSDSENISRFTYHTYEILDGAIGLNELPHARENEEKAQTLIIHLVDSVANLTLKLFYTIFEDSAAIVRSSTIENLSSYPIQINKLLSASIDTLYENQLSTTFYGSHQKEFQLNQAKINHGIFKIGTTRGASGPQYPPYLAITANNVSEFHGSIHAMTLLYSGNHEALIERDQYNHLRMQVGLNSESFSWTLEPNQTFQSPQAVLVFSNQGYNGASQIFHQFFDEHVINPLWRTKERPVVINSWEMAYFDVNETIMKTLIDSASHLGFETVVLDDGWFGNRNNSKTSLGDWFTNQEKFPSGIKHLVDYGKKKNISFGIWFEPEMISPETALMKKHPEWVMRNKSYEPILGRSQYFLDLTNTEVQKFIIDTVSNAINDYGLTYIKWDMNRHMTDPFSLKPKSKNSLEYSHRYILGLYSIMNQLTTNHPNILFENCSSGGGRLDPGMLFYFPQTWISDNTDGFDRQKIQYGASHLFPISSITGHVSDVPNHQTGRYTPFKTRAALASSTNMGYEMNIIDLTSEEKTHISQHIENYKKERSLIFHGDFYRLSSPFHSNITSWMFIDNKKEEAIIYVFRNLYHVNELSFVIKIPYLDNDSYYIDQQTKERYSGSELAHCGLSIFNAPSDFIVHKIHLKRCNDGL